MRLWAAETVNWNMTDLRQLQVIEMPELEGVLRQSEKAVLQSETL